MQLPVHLEFIGQRREALLEGGNVGLCRLVEMHAQKEPAAFVVAKLLCVENVAGQIEQQPGHAIDDTGAVGT